jgi:hypothetical protein
MISQYKTSGKKSETSTSTRKKLEGSSDTVDNINEMSSANLGRGSTKLNSLTDELPSTDDGQFNKLSSANLGGSSTKRNSKITDNEGLLSAMQTFQGSSTKSDSQNTDNEELLSDKLVSQEQLTDDAKKKFSASGAPDNNVDVEISSSLQQQTSMIQKLQEQLEQQQEMMEKFRQQQLEMKMGGGKVAPAYTLPTRDKNAVNDQQVTLTGGWAPQQQQANFYPQQAVTGGSGGWQQQQPNYYVGQQQMLASNNQMQQQPAAVSMLQPGGFVDNTQMQQQPVGISMLPTGGMVSNTQMQQQPGGISMLPTSGVVTNTQMQQQTGDISMLPTGGMVSNVQVMQYQQQPDSVMQSPEAQAHAATSETLSVSDPNIFSGYKDAWDPREKTDIPVFWHVPKAGGSTIKDIMGTCHRLTMASEAGITDGHGEETVSSFTSQQLAICCYKSHCNLTFSEFPFRIFCYHTTDNCRSKNWW